MITIILRTQGSQKGSRSDIDLSRLKAFIERFLKGIVERGQNITISMEAHALHQSGPRMQLQGDII